MNKSFVLGFAQTNLDLRYRPDLPVSKQGVPVVCLHGLSCIVVAVALRKVRYIYPSNWISSKELTSVDVDFEAALFGGVTAFCNAI